ncbi:MAG: hypothetical protein VYC10_03125, partial [Pseudomonadota bacterium]|nr:hypothetical protein [Pseudomonadota bacterium]
MVDHETRPAVAEFLALRYRFIHAAHTHGQRQAREGRFQRLIHRQPVQLPLSLPAFIATTGWYQRHLLLNAHAPLNFEPNAVAVLVQRFTGKVHPKGGHHIGFAQPIIPSQTLFF